MPKTTKKATRVRSAKSGRFAPKAAAKRSPGTTVTEVVKAGRHPAKGLSFTKAVELVLRTNVSIKRRHWNADMIGVTGLTEKEREGAILMWVSRGLIYPLTYAATVDDVLATDWEMV